MRKRKNEGLRFGAEAVRFVCGFAQGSFALWFKCESDVVALGFFYIWSLGGNYCCICQVSA